jgi:hypothetical protein
VEIKVSNEMAKIDRQIARAETLAEINQQSSARHEGLVISQIVEVTKSVLDYTKDAAAQRQFDVVMAGLRADPANATKPFADLAADANKAVLAIRGLSLGVQQKQQSSAPDRTPPKPPITLSGLPTAAASGAKSVTEVVGRLAGDDLEKAFDSLSDADLKKLMRG